MGYSPAVGTASILVDPHKMRYMERLTPDVATIFKVVTTAVVPFILSAPLYEPTSPRLLHPSAIVLPGVLVASTGLVMPVAVDKMAAMLLVPLLATTLNLVATAVPMPR